MKKLVFIFLLCNLQQSSVSQDTLQPLRIGIFAPLYLDSVFVGSQNILGDNLPKNVSTGLEFVLGAKQALDTLKLNNQKLVVSFFDTKSKLQNIRSLQYDKIFDSLNLVIASLNAGELKQLSDICLSKNIPLVSATLPNAVGVKDNPFLIIPYTTFNTHLKGIYQYVLKNYSRAKIILVNKKGINEKRIEEQLNSFRISSELKWQTLTFPDSVSSTLLSLYLDSSKQNVIIGGSTEEVFARGLMENCSQLKNKYKIVLIGMPTWDGIRENHFPKDFSVYFTSSFFKESDDKWITLLKKIYFDLTATTPTELFFKGYETTYYFTNLLLKYREQMISNINDASFKVFTEYDFKGVSQSNNSAIDYFENQKVIFLKKHNGLVSRN